MPRSFLEVQRLGWGRSMAAVGERPPHTIVGLDFGLAEVDDRTDPVRGRTLALLDAEGWDGPPASA